MREGPRKTTMPAAYSIAFHCATTPQTFRPGSAPSFTSKEYHLTVLGVFISLALSLTSLAQSPTFNRDVAPIIFENCVGCHHAGGTGPFPLTSYDEVKKRGRQIVEMTRERIMPPWLPAEGRELFRGARSLTETQINMLSKWRAAGSPEGAQADLKVKPSWPEGWQLGQPDLVVRMPDPYELAAEGPDVYRNFVIPAAVAEDCYVAAFEFQPGNPRVVHHAFLKTDSRGESRRIDGLDAEPGFPGMMAGLSAETPKGTFASWQPGRAPERSPEGMPWILRGKSDLILQMHLRPSGKKEPVQASVGFYFSKSSPKRLPAVMCLFSTAIDIPAGDKDYAVERSYTIPVDGQVLAVLPHMHNLGKSLHAWAELPDGSKKDLLQIPRWDFNWQSAFHYVTPLSLPKGAVVHARLTYDNSSANSRNPNQPPKPVRYGLQTADEMGELWFQFLSDDPADDAPLQRDYYVKFAMPDKLARIRLVLEKDPADMRARADLAGMLLFQGKFDEAKREARRAAQDNPKDAFPHEMLGNIYLAQNLVAPARIEFAEAVNLDPENANTQNNLGYLLLLQGKPDEALPHLEKALELNPNDALAQQNLTKARAAAKK